ncbi:MAG: hypothetical protein AB7I38_09110 [Dehalococcoidia bacterium]
MGEGTLPIVEVKRKLDGSEQRFDCELIEHTPRLVIARYRLEATAGPIDSYGVFWARRPYLCYHMVHRADGREWVSRFDVVRDVRLGACEVSYTDLLLDLWVDADGPRWEDDDEVEAAAVAGLLTRTDRERIARTRAALDGRHRTVVREVRARLARLGALPGGGYFENSELKPAASGSCTT